MILIGATSFYKNFFYKSFVTITLLIKYLVHNLFSFIFFTLYFTFFFIFYFHYCFTICKKKKKNNQYKLKPNQPLIDHNYQGKRKVNDVAQNDNYRMITNLVYQNTGQTQSKWKRGYRIWPKFEKVPEIWKNNNYVFKYILSKQWVI